MARLVITNFVAGGYGAIGCHGFYQNGMLYQIVGIDGIAYDPTISTSVRAQVLDNVVAKFNESKSTFNLQTEPDIIASDIEVMC